MPHILINRLLQKQRRYSAGSQRSCFSQGSQVIFWLKSNDTEAKGDLSGAQVHAHALTGFNTNPGPYVVLDSRVSRFTGQSVLWHHPLLLSHIWGCSDPHRHLGPINSQPVCQHRLGGFSGNALHHFVHDSMHTFQQRETSMNASLLNPL